MNDGDGAPPGFDQVSSGGGRGNDIDLGGEFADLLESAAELQRLIPDTILVGGSAAAIHARHRVSFDHDHTLGNLRDRFDIVLEALEAEGKWVTARTEYGKLILGSLGGIETGVRQLIRARPLEFEEVALPSGALVRVPTFEETLRIKAFLIVKRNRMRDYLDVAALAAHAGTERAARVLARIDEYYAGRDPEELVVAGQVADQLHDPRPADTRAVRNLADYKRLDPRWHDWSRVTAVCQDVAAKMLGLPDT